MTRAERLLSLLQVLRRHRRPVSGRVLAGAGISLRTVYRDIASLQAQGADIEGEAGIGYVLRAGFMLPPLMFSQAELEALMLGFRWVGKFADAQLTAAAADALAKISAVLPAELRREMECTTLLVGPRTIVDRETIDMGVVRAAIRTESKLGIRYAGERRKRSTNGSCGRSRSAISMTCGSWRRGAKAGTISGISGRIASLRSNRWTCAIHGGARRC